MLLSDLRRFALKAKMAAADKLTTVKLDLAESSRLRHYLLEQMLGYKLDGREFISGSHFCLECKT